MNYEVGIQETEKLLGRVCEDWKSLAEGCFMFRATFLIVVGWELAKDKEKKWWKKRQ